MSLTLVLYPSLITANPSCLVKDYAGEPPHLVSGSSRWAEKKKKMFNQFALFFRGLLTQAERKLKRFLR